MSGSRREGLFALAGLAIERVTLEGEMVRVSAKSVSPFGICPLCCRRSLRVHSRYERRLADLPAHGRRVEIMVTVRRFRCADDLCRRRIFSERLDPAVAAAHERQTGRLAGIVHHLGMALGGRPAQATARRLLLPVSKDTLLRTVRRSAQAPSTPPRVIGVDD